MGFKDGKCFYIDFKGGGIDEDKEHRENNKRRAPESRQLSQGQDFHSGIIVKDRERERPSLNEDTEIGRAHV